MSTRHPIYIYLLPVMIAAILTAGPACAGKPSHAEGGKHSNKQSKSDKHDNRKAYGPSGPDQNYAFDNTDHFGGNYFVDRHRNSVREFYSREYRSGHCPPGLAKKHNGCMPPGQAKLWRIGQPLPTNIVYYDLPAPILAEFGPPPQGYRFVRVASDILMIAVGTNMVMDAIQDLGGW